MTTSPVVHISPIPQGKTHTLLSEEATAAGTQVRTFSTDADSLLASLYVTSVSGTLDVVIYTYTEDGKEVEAIRFPTITGPTSELLLRKAAAIVSNLRLEVTYTGACTYEVRGRGITAGEASVRIASPGNARTFSTTVTSSAALLFPISLTDRNGLCIRNWNTSGVMYIGFSLAQATTAAGYPIAPREQFAMDLEAGATLYAVSDGPTIDVRVVEAGN